MKQYKMVIFQYSWQCHNDMKNMQSEPIKKHHHEKPNLNVATGIERQELLFAMSTFSIRKYKINKRSITIIIFCVLADEKMATSNGAASSEDLNQQPIENQSKGSGNHDRKHGINKQRSGHNSGKQETEIEDKPLNHGTQNRQSRKGKKQEPPVDTGHKNLNNPEASDLTKNENTKKPPQKPRNKPEREKGVGTSEPSKSENPKNKHEKEKQKGVRTSEPSKGEYPKNKPEKGKQRVVPTPEAAKSDKTLCTPDAADVAASSEKGEHVSVISAARKLNKPRNKATQTEVLGMVHASETELPMEFQKQNQVSSEKWEALVNQHKKTTHAAMAKIIKPANDKPCRDEARTNTESHRNTGNNEINDADFYELQRLRHDVEKQVKDFWGPLEDVEPLQIKMGQILKAFSKKFPTECVKSLEAASKLLQQRTPMIESAGVGQDDSSDSDAEQGESSDAKVKVMEIGMQALQLYKELSLATSRDHSKLLSLQLKFTECQTKLDAIPNLTPGDNSVVNIHVLCNDALNVLDGLLDLNQKFHSVISISKPTA